MLFSITAGNEATARVVTERRAALVMGAGGPVGHGFHAGVLAALHDAWGWDPRHADLVVGTSAGAGVGALLRAGLSPADFVARVTGQSLSSAGRAIAEHYERPTEILPGAPARMWPASSRYLARACLRPWTVRPGPLFAAALPRGRLCLQRQAEGLRKLFGDTWPARKLWITAVGLDCGARVAFGRDDAPAIDVGTAVICSSAVPSVCLPIEIGNRRYIDGGIASATHLDLIEDAPEIQTVVVSSPLSRMPGMRTLLRRELARLVRCGVDVVCFEPGPAVARAMGWNPMDPERVAAVATVTREALRERLRASVGAGARALPEHRCYES